MNDVLVFMIMVFGVCAVVACILLGMVCRRLSDISESLRDLKSWDLQLNMGEDLHRRVGDVLQKALDVLSRPRRTKPRKKTSEGTKKAGV